MYDAVQESIYASTKMYNVECRELDKIPQLIDRIAV
jgi:hypothetical protein